MRIAAFLGQIAHESGELKRVQEDLRYSPQRIHKMWPARFPTVESALKYGRNPERLGNVVYANRMGNGDEKSGDGFKFRGRGLMQITGRANYERMAKLLDLPALVDRPDYLLEPRYAALSAAAFWSDNGLNREADKIENEPLLNVVTTITKTINGGTNGLDERLEYTERALDYLDMEFAA